MNKCITLVVWISLFLTSGTKADTVPGWAMLSCCIMPPQFAQSLFDTKQLLSAEREKRPLSPVVLVPSSDPKMPSPKTHLMVFAPEFGLATERALTGPTDKSAGKWIFTPWHKVNRPLKVGDTFGWRMRIYAPDLGTTEYPPVLDEVIVPKGTPLHTRYSPGTWIDNRPEDERGKPSPHNGHIFYNVQEFPENGKQFWSLTGGPKVLPSVTGTFHAFNFWTITQQDLRGQYRFRIWLHNKQIAEVTLEVQP